MSYYVHIVVMFNCYGGAGVTDLAQRYVPAMEDYHERVELPAIHSGESRFEGGESAGRFLTYVAAGRGIGGAGRGGMLCWGGTANYLDVERFVEVLRPFWRDLLDHYGIGEDQWDGPNRMDHVLILHQREDEEAASAIQIKVRDVRARAIELEINRFGSLPFPLDNQP